MSTDLNLADMESGYKAFRCEIIQAIRIEQNGFGFEPEITAKIAKLRVRICKVPTLYYGITYMEGEKIGWRDGIHVFWQ
jgi:hypothetical protein